MSDDLQHFAAVLFYKLFWRDPKYLSEEEHLFFFVHEVAAQIMQANAVFPCCCPKELVITGLVKVTHRHVYIQ